MYVIKVENKVAVGHPINYENFLSVFPNCPRQEVPTNDVISPYGYEVFVHTPEPSVGIFEKSPIVGSYIVNDGIWTNTWITVPMTDEEIEKVKKRKWREIRGQRDTSLKQCDWTQLSDVELSETDIQLWKQYRKDLRNLPNTAINPFDIVLPTPPYPFSHPYTPGEILPEEVI